MIVIKFIILLKNQCQLNIYNKMIIKHVKNLLDEKKCLKINNSFKKQKNKHYKYNNNIANQILQMKDNIVTKL